MKIRLGGDPSGFIITDRLDEANARFLQYCEHAKK